MITPLSPKGGLLLDKVFQKTTFGRLLNDLTGFKQSPSQALNEKTKQNKTKTHNECFEYSLEYV